MKKEFVRVIWLDATSEDAWTPISEVESRCRSMETVGILFAETEQVITVALSFDDEGGFVSNYISIPTAWIVSRELLGVRRPRKKKKNEKTLA